MTESVYFWDSLSDSILGESDGAGKLTAINTVIPSGFGRLISENRNGVTEVHQYDALGSTRQITDSGGNVTDWLVFDAWGQLVEHDGASTSRFLWVGEMGYLSFQNPESGIAVRRRWYDSSLGRWWSRDPLSLAAGLNSYQYTGNQPVSAIDPSGLIPPLQAWTCVCPDKLTFSGHFNLVIALGPACTQAALKIAAQACCDECCPKCGGVGSLLAVCVQVCVSTIAFDVADCLVFP